MPRTSDFGSGYATCLRQFANHRSRLREFVAAYSGDTWPAFFEKWGGDADSHAAEMWFNGASDHLYDLRMPRRMVPKADQSAAKKLADAAIDIGHGRGLMGTRKTSIAEGETLLDVADALLAKLAERGFKVDTLEECMETDRALGITPIPGTWSCPLDLEPRG